MQNYLSFSKLFEICKSDKLWQMGHPTVKVSSKKLAVPNIIQLLLLVQLIFTAFYKLVSFALLTSVCLLCSSDWVYNHLYSSHRPPFIYSKECPQIHSDVAIIHQTLIQRQTVAEVGMYPQPTHKQFTATGFRVIHQLVHIWNPC